MKEIVFLVEGEAEKYLLNALVPRLLTDGVVHRVIPFQGKQDMEKRLTMRIRAYQNPHARFIVLRDQDSHPDCVALKQELLDRCRTSGRYAHCRVRIVCTELETFYLADLSAVAQVLKLPTLRLRQSDKKFRNPDRLGSPSRELRSLSGGRYQKLEGSRLLGACLELDNGRSPSFRNLVASIRRAVSELAEI